MISIIIPFYNTEKYFEKCLSSIKAQTFSTFECLLIDDGSTDKSREIAQKYVEEDSRFILLNDKHIGYPACKNLGLDKAKGEYVCFIDSDDFVEKYHLENLYKAITSTKSDIASCGFLYMENCEIDYTNDSYTDEFMIFEGTENILRKYFTNTYPWTKLFKKELYDNLRFRNVEALSDMLLNYKVFEKAKKTVYTKYRSYHYRVHNESITYNVRNKSDTYWPYRLNVYLEVFSYVVDKYPNLIDRAKIRVTNEFYFCLPHLSEDEIERVKNDERFKKLTNIV